MLLVVEVDVVVDEDVDSKGVASLLDSLPPPDDDAVEFEFEVEVIFTKVG